MYGRDTGSSFRQNAVQNLNLGIQVHPQTNQIDTNYISLTNQYPESARTANDPMINKIQMLVEKYMTCELPNHLKCYSDSIDSLNLKVENNLNQTQELGGKIREISLTVNSSNNKVSQNEDKIRSVSDNVIKLQNRLTQAFESQNIRFQNIESHVTQITNFLRTLVSRQTQLEQSLCEQFSILINEIHNIQIESRNSDHILSSQIISLQDQTVSTFSKVESGLVLAGSSIYSLATSTKEAFQMMSQENNALVQDFQIALDSRFVDTQNSLQTLQKNLNETVDNLKGSISPLMTALNEESQMRTASDRKIEELLHTNISQMSAQISAQTAAQIAAQKVDADSIQKAAAKQTELTCNSFLAAWKGELSGFLGDTSSTVASCSKRVTAIENRLSEYVVSVGKRQDELYHLITSQNGDQLPNTGRTSSMTQPAEIIEQEGTRLYNSERSSPKGVPIFRRNFGQMSYRPPPGTKVRRPKKMELVSFPDEKPLPPLFGIQPVDVKITLTEPRPTPPGMHIAKPRHMHNSRHRSLDDDLKIKFDLLKETIIPKTPEAPKAPIEFDFSPTKLVGQNHNIIDNLKEKNKQSTNVDKPIINEQRLIKEESPEKSQNIEKIKSVKEAPILKKPEPKVKTPEKSMNVNKVPEKPQLKEISDFETNRIPKPEIIDEDPLDDEKIIVEPKEKPEKEKPKRNKKPNQITPKKDSPKPQETKQNPEFDLALFDCPMESLAECSFIEDIIDGKVVRH